MKKLIVLFLCLCFLNNGAETTINWTPPIDTNIVKFNIYSITNKTSIKFASVDSTSNSLKISVTPGKIYTFFVTSENGYFVESLPSTSITYTYPIGIPPTVFINPRSSAGTLTNAWKDIRIVWQNSPYAYAVNNYYLYFETQNFTNVYLLKTNDFTIKTLPFNNYKIYAQAENILGKSKVTTNSIVYLNRANSKKILEAEK